MPNRESKKNSGFTLIELLMVMSIIGTLGGIFLLNYPSAARKSRDSKRLSDIKQYQTALEVYANSNNNAYPVSTGNISLICPSRLNLPACPNDPQTGQIYSYAGNVSAFVLWARLEQPDTSGNTQYFISCSNGLSGNKTAAPTSPTCPLP